MYALLQQLVLLPICAHTPATIICKSTNKDQLPIIWNKIQYVRVSVLLE